MRNWTRSGRSRTVALRSASSHSYRSRSSSMLREVGTFLGFVEILATSRHGLAAIAFGERRLGHGLDSRFWADRGALRVVDRSRTAAAEGRLAAPRVDPWRLI